MLGREIRSPFVITRHDPPDRQDFHTLSGPIRPNGIMRCEKVKGGTCASYEFTLTGFLGVLMTWPLAHGMTQNLNNVKRVLEDRS